MTLESWQMDCFEITVRGFYPYTLRAKTRSQARYAAYRQYCDGWMPIPFRDFLKIVTVKKI